VTVEVSAPSLRRNDSYIPGLSRDYVAREYGIPPENVAKLGSAENPLGPSPRAVEAVERAKADLSIYPEWTARRLREAIGDKYGFEPDSVACGAGETEIISFVIRAFAAAGDAVLMHEPCFPVYHIFAENESRRPVYVPMGDGFDPVFDRYVETLRASGPKIAFLTNPHSPTGRLMPEEDIRRVCKTAPDVLVVLDEAYIHYSETDGGIHLTREHDNLIVLRTFSKAYGLAGLRLGFAIAANKALIAPLISIKPTWNLGQMQIAGGVAAVGNDEHVSRTVETIVGMRDYVAERLAKLNRFRMVPGSRSNFFLLEVADPGLDSTSLFHALLERGVITKDGSVSFRGLGRRFLRIDVSLRKHMDRLVDALREIEARR
jgi:histidinol-phosphate aminotransferase